MKIAELRIGNLLKSNQSNTICEVNGLSEDEITANSLTSIWDEFKYDQVEPIPLNEEWLLKFGFIKSKEGFYKNFIDLAFNDIFKYWIVAEYDEIDGQGHLFRTKINFIHQLQNLYFALTEQELRMN